MEWKRNFFVTSIE